MRRYGKHCILTNAKIRLHRMHIPSDKDTRKGTILSPVAGSLVYRWDYLRERKTELSGRDCSCGSSRCIDSEYDYYRITAQKRLVIKYRKLDIIDDYNNYRSS